MSQGAISFESSTKFDVLGLQAIVDLVWQLSLL